MRLAALGLVLAACGGGASTVDGGPDPSDAAAIDAAAGAGTWDDPKVITALPYTDHDDTTGRANRASAYDCAPTTDEGGGEVVYRLDLAAPTYVRVAVDDAPGDQVDVDVNLLDAAATTSPATGCLARDNLTVLRQLPAGSTWIAIDTWVNGSGVALPGAYTLSVGVAQGSGDCLTNPIPSCTAATTPDVNGVPVEPAGIGACPAGMTPVAGFCIDRWEAALVVDDAGGPHGFSPYAHPTTEAVRAVSAPGIVPQAYISGTVAGQACARAGKRLCSDSEWLRACRGASNTTYPYGDTRQPGVCNDARTCHPAIQYFETTADTVWSMLGHPCIDQLPDSLDPTGANPGCVSADGAFDLMGNLHEWTSDPAGTFRGGYYVDTYRNGEGCLYTTTAHDVSHWDYSTGFRCCADPLQ
ncbi:MAG: formylglycine-generating enzyme family protein [Deltaproteobacteria bacterium]|nr:formylglycine-generating enzyme family protein [Deltaproteobacteria bacterium]